MLGIRRSPASNGRSPAGADPQQPPLDLDDFDFDAFQEADQKCSPLLANVGIGFDLGPEEQAAFEDAQLVFADCMQELGVEVPEFSGGAVIGAITIEGDSTDFHAPDPQGDCRDSSTSTCKKNSARSCMSCGTLAPVLTAICDGLPAGVTPMGVHKKNSTRRPTASRSGGYHSVRRKH